MEKLTKDQLLNYAKLLVNEHEKRRISNIHYGNSDGVCSQIYESIIGRQYEGELKEQREIALFASNAVKSIYKNEIPLFLSLQ